MSLIATATEPFLVIVDQASARWITAATEVKRESVDGDELVMTPDVTWHLTKESFSNAGRPCRSVTVCMMHNPDIIVEEWRVPDPSGD